MLDAEACHWLTAAADPSRALHIPQPGHKVSDERREGERKGEREGEGGRETERGGERESGGRGKEM